MEREVGFPKGPRTKPEDEILQAGKDYDLDVTDEKIAAEVRRIVNDAKGTLVDGENFDSKATKAEIQKEAENIAGDIERPKN